MSADTSRAALHRIGRELGITTPTEPCHLATQIIKRIQHDSELVTRLENALQAANRRLETLGVTP